MSRRARPKRRKKPAKYASWVWWPLPPPRLMFRMHLPPGHEMRPEGLFKDGKKVPE